MKIRPNYLSIEYFFAIFIVAGIIYQFWFLFTYKYFSQPFFYDIGDTWMDWFNPAYWSHEPGAYDYYNTVYPPLTYVILRLITDGSCYTDNWGGYSRYCDVLGVISLHVVYVACIYLTVMVLIKTDRKTALPRSVAISLGLPMMWALDRGNVILITYIFVLLAYGPLIRSAMMRWLFVGLAVNMKVYLISTVAAQLLHRRWRWAECAIISSILVYLVTLAWFGSGDPLSIYRNITDFAGSLTINNPLDVWMASSLLPIQRLADSDVYPLSLYIGSRNVQIIMVVTTVLMRSAQLIVVAGAVACWLRPEAVPRYRMIAMSIGLTIFSTEVSSYTQILVLLFLFMERSKGAAVRYAIAVGYIICIPIDIDLDKLAPLAKESFFFGTTVFVEYKIQLGPFIRPILTMSIPVALAIATIQTVWRDIRTQGWADRWRFRRDVPLLPWVRRPQPLGRTGTVAIPD